MVAQGPIFHLHNYLINDSAFDRLSPCGVKHIMSIWHSSAWAHPALPGVMRKCNTLRLPLAGVMRRGTKRADGSLNMWFAPRHQRQRRGRPMSGVERKDEGAANWELRAAGSGLWYVV